MQNDPLPLNFLRLFPHHRRRLQNHEIRMILNAQRTPQHNTRPLNNSPPPLLWKTRTTQKRSWRVSLTLSKHPSLIQRPSASVPSQMAIKFYNNFRYQVMNWVVYLNLPHTKKKTCSTALWEKGRRYTWIKKKCWKQTGKSKILAAFSYMVRLKTRNLTYFKTLPLAVSVAYWRIPVSTTTIGQWSSSRKDCNSALCWTAKRWPVIWLRWLICFGSFSLAQFTPTRTANPSKTRCNNWRKTT